MRVHGERGLPAIHSPVRQEAVQRGALLAGHRLINAQIWEEALRPLGQLQPMLALAVLPMMVVMVDDATVVLCVGDIVIGVAVARIPIGHVRPDAGHGRRLTGAGRRGAAGRRRTERLAGRHGDGRSGATDAAAQRQGGPFEKVHDACVRVFTVMQRFH